MKSLYSRIVVTFILISLFSGIVALLGVNFYYQFQLKAFNEQKILHIGKEIRSLYEQTEQVDMDTYFTHIAGMGFQIYVVNDQLQGTFYGAPFKHAEIEPSLIRNVLEGQTYHSPSPFVTGLFENDIKHSIGIPLDANGHRLALFVRPNLQQQFGEIRDLTGLLIVLTFLFSIVFIIIFSRYIVKPVEKLTEATRTIVEGQYDLALDVDRRDEIGNLARHFASMAQSLQKLDEMRQEFVANVSHEIQSPLTSIQGFAQTIRTEEVTAGEKDRYLQIIENESRRLSSLSKQLLTLASLDKDSASLKKTSYRLDEQIKQIVALTEWQQQEKSVTVHLDLAEVVITADQQLLHQVWMNLLSNSLKFSPDGSAICVQMQLEQDITIVVQNEGDGIAESDLPYLFDRFYKADKGRSRSQSGSGLGLAIVKKIVDMHDGSIEVRSKIGQGVTMIIHLPHL